MGTLIFDTAAVLNFGHRGDLAHLLNKLSGHYILLITHDVIAELTDPKLRPFYDALIAAHFQIQSSTKSPFDLETLTRLSRTIDRGELSVLLLAREINATAVLDDRAARREAGSLNIRIIGTVGLMNEAVQKTWMTESECLAHIIKLCDSGFRIPRPTPGQPLADYLKAIQ